MQEGMNCALPLRFSLRQLLLACRLITPARLDRHYHHHCPAILTLLDSSCSSHLLVYTVDALATRFAMSASAGTAATRSSTTATVTATAAHEAASTGDVIPYVLHLAPAKPASRATRKRVEWTDDVVDNEQLNRKKSKSRTAAHTALHTTQAAEQG